MSIYDDELGEESSQKLSEEIKSLITSLGGMVVSSNFWGKRKFAYEINHKEEGYYDIIKFDMDKSKSSDFRKKLNVMDSLVRYLITALE